MLFEVLSSVVADARRIEPVNCGILRSSQLHSFHGPVLLISRGSCGRYYRSSPVPHTFLSTTNRGHF